jgi:hypothetical protein
MNQKVDELAQAVQLSLVRNPYTGAFYVDKEKLRVLLASVWDSGYRAGLDDGIGDSLYANRSGNPFLDLLS